MTTRNDYPFDQSRRRSQPMRILLALAIAVLLVAAITDGLATDGFQGRDDDGRDDERAGPGTYAIGLWGDLPYSTTQATVGMHHAFHARGARARRHPRHAGISRESIELLKKLGVKMTPELKSPSVTMPFNGVTQAAYAQKMIDEYKRAGVSPRNVFAQSFDKNDLLYWINHEPAFGKQAVLSNDRFSHHPRG